MTASLHKILAVDDEPDIVSLMEYNLKREGFSVVTASDGEEAFRLATRSEFSLILLDLMLPGMSGLELCRMLRQDPKTRNVPIIMVTAKGEEEDRVRGLDTGADDYLPKPFSPRELVARVKAVLRRSSTHGRPEDVLRVGDLAINKDTYRVAKKGRPLELSATEFRLLLFLAERKGRVFGREQLLDAVWKDEAVVEPRTVDVHIRRLRMAIEDDPADPRYVKTRRGVGYYMESDRS